MQQNKILSNQLNKPKSYFNAVPLVALSGLFFTTTASAAISAHTILTIEWTKPYIQLRDGSGNVAGDLMTLEQLVGFTMPDGSGIVQKDASHSTTSGAANILAPAGMKFSDVVTIIKADGVAYGIASTNAADGDGDANNGAGNILGNMKATWYSDDRQMVTDLDQPLSDCDGSYTLVIEANDISVETAYGNPSTNTYGSQNPVTYTFLPSGFPKFCYIMTGSHSVFSTSGAPGVNSKYPATGYNPDLWVEYTGFSIEKMNAAGVSYPTTGFNKARLMFEASGYVIGQVTRYRCTTTSSWITLSSRGGYGENCMVTYNTDSKPTTPAVINLEYYDGSTWTQKDSYTIPVPTTWARVKGRYAYANDFFLSSSTEFPAASMCKDDTTTSVTTAAEAATYFFTRQELSNGPDVTVPAASWVPNTSQRFARDVDGTFEGEWGSLNNSYYPDSGLSTDDNSYTWTGEAFNDYLMLVNSHYTGRTYRYNISTALTAMCK